MKWCLEHPGPYTLNEEIELRKEAMAALVESVKTGDITSLDGVESPLSERIRARHGVTDFEMNSNWVGSSQDWICPCCGRSKFQVSRVGKKGQILAKLVVHHDLSMVKDYFDKLIMINQTLVAYGNSEDVFTPELVNKTYGGRLTMLQKTEELVSG